MLQPPWPVYVESQLAACGIAIMDNTIARMLRPSLFVGGSGALEDFNRPIERARADGTLYSAVLKTCRPGEEGKTERTTTGIIRTKTPEDRRDVLVIALSSSRLAERLRWFGLDVESVATWREPEPALETTSDEIAARGRAAGASGL